MAADVSTTGEESSWYPHAIDVRKGYFEQVEYASALLEGLHRFYSNDDNDLWFESFMRTKEYEVIDSLNGGDWEDFYYYETPQLEDWFCTYGTIEEPSENYKKHINSLKTKSYESKR
jgi:hypothetical protein